MSWTERLGGYLPEMPTLGSEAEIAVYVVHNSGEAENYFFLFDFEEFVDLAVGHDAITRWHLNPAMEEAKSFTECMHRAGSVFI